MAWKCKLFFQKAYYSTKKRDGLIDYILHHLRTVMHKVHYWDILPSGNEARNDVGCSGSAILIYFDTMVKFDHHRSAKQSP